MRCGEVIKLLEELAPLNLACDWDNPGLMVGMREDEVSKILLAVDCTEEVIDYAIETGADMIITHHPMLFRGLKKINGDDFISKKVIDLIRHGIACYAMHTNFDSAPGCMGDLAGEILGLQDMQVLEYMGDVKAGDSLLAEEPRQYGIGSIGEFIEPMTLVQAAELVKKGFGLDHVVVFGDVDSDRLLKTAAVCPGAGGSVIDEAISKGADVYISGDMTHHKAIDAVAQGMVIIDAGHYGVEHIFMEFMKEHLAKVLPEMPVCTMPKKLPNTVI